jgi:GT2 family glycosyltransferase
MARPGQPGEPAVSVVVCAYTLRRWDETRAAVASLTGQTRPPREILLVVDHNPELAARARAGLPGVRVLDNDRSRGLSGARNTGVAAACGEIVAFLDDDAEAAPDWLDRLTGPYRSAEVVAVGGAARPRWPAGSGRPGWLSATGVLDWVIGCSYTGQPTALAEVRNIMGCAMSFRRSVFDRVGGFSTAVGRRGTVPLGCEETELCIRARQRIPRARILFEPRAVVDHHVSPDRLRWSYLRRRSWAEGVSKAAVSGMAGSGDALSTERHYVRAVIPAAMRHDLARAFTGHAAGAAGIAIAVLTTSAGYLSGSLRRRRSPTGAPTATTGEARPAPESWTPRVSVVVPTARHHDGVHRCVKSLLGTGYPDLEVLVVDNRPGADGTADLRELATVDGRTRYLAEPRPGVSHARNTGLAGATGELVAFVDDDIEVDPAWLTNLVAELADARVDCATSLLLPRFLDTAAQRKFEQLKGFGQGSRRRTFGPESARDDPLYPFAPGRFGPGGCALWRRSAVRSLGGFDPLLGPGTATRAGEDLDLFLRLAVTGGSIVYTPRAVAWHEHGAEWAQLRERLRAYGTGLSAMFVRHLLRRPADTPKVAAMAAKRLRRVLTTGPAGHGEPGHTEASLVLDHLSGLARGPLALARSARAARREPKRGGG